jgi:hypothetical protein
VQTTLLGLAIAFIIALLAALVGPYFIDWNQFRPQFEANASKVIGAPVRVAGGLEARLLPTPSLRLRSVVVGGANDLGKVRAERLDVEFSLGDLMRGEWRANELSIDGIALDLGLDRDGHLDWPASNGTFDVASLAIDRLNLTGRAALHDAASRTTLELSDIAFSGDVRSLAGSLRGDGHFTLWGARYPFRVSSGQGAGGGARVHLSINPAERALSVDMDGVLGFEARSPHFEGAVTLAALPPPRTNSGEPSPTPWRIATKVKADHSAAEIEQIEATYGKEDRALKFSGQGDIRFGGSPLLRATLSARQLDADKLIAGENAGDKVAVVPLSVLPALREAMASLPRPPIAARIEAGVEQITLGGRALQNLSAGLHADATSWAIDHLDVRAPGATHVAFGATGVSADLAGTLDIESSDPEALLSWLQGRSDLAYHSQKPLRLRGDVGVASGRLTINALRAEIEGGAIEGRVALDARAEGGGSRFEASLKAERLDLDAAAAFARSLVGPQAEWPQQAAISFDADRVMLAGQELRPFAVKFGYGPRIVALEQLKFGGAGGLTVEGTGSLDRNDASGILALHASAASLGQMTTLLAPFSPSLAARLNSMAIPPGAARLKLSLDVGRDAARPDRANARAVFDLNVPQFKGTATVSAQPALSALRSIDLDALGQSEISIVSKLLTERGETLLALLGLDRAVAAGDGALQFEGSASGVWHEPMRLNAKIWGAGMDAEAQGTADPWAEALRASANLRVRSINLGPAFGLKPSDRVAQGIRLFANVSVAGNKLTFDNLDSVAAGSRLRGHLALTLDEQKDVDGEIGLDTLDLAPLFAFAIGATGRDAAEPLGAGLLKGWRGHVAFQAQGGVLPGGSELRPLGGSLKSDGRSLTFDAIKGRIGGGDVTAGVEVTQDAKGLALNARLGLANVEGAALRYRSLKMPAGRVSMQATLSSQGRSLAALTGALSGSGTVTLESVSIAGLDPNAFEAAIRASDSGQLADDAKLRQVVETVLSAGALPVVSAQIPFNVRDGRLRIDATTLEAPSARAIVSGGYDILADQADIRASLTSTAIGSGSSRPEIQLFAMGTPDALVRSVDVASLSSWLAVRAIDRETRRLDAIERGEPPPVEPPIVPPSTAALPSAATPETAPSGVPLPGRDPRRPQPKAKAAPPRLPGVPPATAPPVTGQQVAPLPPPIEVHPAPAPAPLPAKPKPRAPLALTPPPSTNP